MAQLTEKFPDLTFIGKEAQKSITGDRLYFLVLSFCIISFLLQAGLIISAHGKLPPEVPLFYSRPWGEDILASPQLIWILPAVAFLFSLTNFFLSRSVAKGNIFLSRILVLFSFLIALSTLYDTTKILTLLT